MPTRKRAENTAPAEAGQIDIPIQPVEKPILCSPYQEPGEHWLYDRSTGIPARTPGRRPASYWYRSERSGSAQQRLPGMTQEDTDDLPLVNALREDVRRWRASGWLGASETSKTLLRHWWREDRSRRLFFCQLEAAETVIYLREMLAQGRKTRFTPKLTLQDHAALMQGHNPRPLDWVAKVAQHPKLIDKPHDSAEALTRYAARWPPAAARRW